MSVRRRPDATVIVAVVLMLVVLAGAAGVGTPDDPPAPTEAPERATLAQAVLACPLQGAGGGEVRWASTSGEVGEVDLVAASADTIRLEAHTVGTTAPRPGSLLVATAGAAPGFHALRLSRAEAAVAACAAPVADQWFTGVAGDAVHRSTLELVNPDEGPAVADLVLHGPDGVVDAPRLRGLRVDGGERTAIDLGVVTPGREELAVQVVVSRGRLATMVRDEIVAVGSGPAGASWLPPQVEPALRSTLLGLGPGAARRTLVIANPGADEARVGLEILTGTSTFTPADVEEVVVAPGSTTTVALTGVLRREVGDGAVGLVLTSSEPVTASLATMSRGSRSHAVPAEAVGTSGLVVPPGSSRLVLTAVEQVATATITTWDADGDLLGEERVEVDPGSAGEYDLPEGAASLRVDSAPGPLLGALVTTRSAGVAVLPLRPDRRDALVPRVRPGLP